MPSLWLKLCGRTLYGCVPEPGKELAEQFLKLAHYDEGGRLFTYVLMLDGQLRFTETGKNFGIDLVSSPLTTTLTYRLMCAIVQLSKHTMHSDVSQYVACSGEFFVRRLERFEEADKPVEEQQAHPPKEIDGGPPETSPPTDPRFYELIIDNE